MDKLKTCPFCGGDAIFFRKAYAVNRRVTDGAT
jgi:hypothetical protein